jgi:hypothetical protein
MGVGLGDLADNVDRPVLGRFPITRQQLMQFAGRVIGDAGQDIGEPGLAIDVVHFGCDEEGHHAGESGEFFTLR